MTFACLHAGATLAALLGMALAVDDTSDCFSQGTGYNDSAVSKPDGGFPANALACQTLCQQQSSICARFTYYNNTKACWLQSINATAFTEVNATSGPMNCSEKGTTPSSRSSVTDDPVDTVDTGSLDAEASAIWKKILAGDSSFTQTAISSTPASIGTGLSLAELAGKVVVVHDVTGAKVACSPLLAYAGQNLFADSFTKFPGYLGPLSVTGNVTFKSEQAGEQTMEYELKGSDPECGKKVTDGVANACGIHIHAGATCAAAGAHFYNHTTDSTDPWKSLMYVTRPVVTAQELEGLGAPTRATKVGDGYKFVWKDGASITVEGAPDALKVTGAEGVGATGSKSPERDTGKPKDGGGFPMWLVIVLVILALVGAGGGGYWYLNQPKKDKKKKTSKKNQSGSASQVAVAGTDPEQPDQQPLMDRETPAAAGQQSGTIAGQQSLTVSGQQPYTMAGQQSPSGSGQQVYTVAGQQSPVSSLTARQQAYTMSGQQLPTMTAQQAQPGASAFAGLGPAGQQVVPTSSSPMTMVQQSGQYTVAGVPAPAQQYTVAGAAAPAQQYTVGGYR